MHALICMTCLYAPALRCMNLHCMCTSPCFLCCCGSCSNVLSPACPSLYALDLAWSSAVIPLHCNAFELCHVTACSLIMHPVPFPFLHAPYVPCMFASCPACAMPLPNML